MASRSYRMLAAAAVAAALALAGCAPGPAEPSMPDPSHTAPRPSDASTTTATPTTTPDASTPAQPIGLDCADLVSIQALYDLNPNLSLVPDANPPAGSVAAVLAAGQGVVCDLTHNSSGATLRLGAAMPGSDLVAELRTATSRPPIDGFEVFTGPGANTLVAVREQVVVSAEGGDFFDESTVEEALRIALAAFA